MLTLKYIKLVLLISLNSEPFSTIQYLLARIKHFPSLYQALSDLKVKERF